MVGTWTDAELEDDDNGEDCMVELPWPPMVVLLLAFDMVVTAAPPATNTDGGSREREMEPGPGDLGKLCGLQAR